MFRFIYIFNRKLMFYPSINTPKKAVLSTKIGTYFKLFFTHLVTHYISMVYNSKKKHKKLDNVVRFMLYLYRNHNNVITN